MTRIHVALCVICGQGIKKQGDVWSPALDPFNLPGFHASDRAHHKCANKAAREHFASANKQALARAEFTHENGT